MPDITFRSPDPQPESPAARLVDSKEELAVVYSLAGASTRPLPGHWNAVLKHPGCDVLRVNIFAQLSIATYLNKSSSLKIDLLP